jgi:hypothetical protein
MATWEKISNLYSTEGPSQVYKAYFTSYYNTGYFNDPHSIARKLCPLQFFYAVAKESEDSS